ncbi:MAG: NAD-dependent epimerase [Balneolales bacterium]
MHILVTGAAGFIGYHLSRRLLEEGHRVTGLDNINDYYTPTLKYGRLAGLGISRRKIAGGRATESRTFPGFRFFKMDLQDGEGVGNLFAGSGFDAVAHLAAQAGVRYSIDQPRKYIDSNISGFLNILEACRHQPVQHLLFASSSSVYGANTRMPFSTRDNVDHPVSLYAATKKANELMAHTYSHLYDIPATGLRFFTVYGPWGRPDMAYFKFAGLITAGKPIDVYNHGRMERDFTYIDDIVECVVRLIPKPPSGNPGWSGDTPDPSTSFAPYRLFNIGNNHPVPLMDFIDELERQLDTTAQKNMMPIQPGDVPKTWAEVTGLYEYIGYRPRVPLSEGIANFVAWYRKYYGV